MPSNFNNQELTEIKFNGVDVSEAYFNGALFFDANQFVSTWRTTTANETIYIPTSTFIYVIDWGDGTITNNTNFHEYAIAGDYTIKISGNITDFRFNNTSDKDKILEVTNFGNFDFQNSSFYGCSNLVQTQTKPKQITSFENSYNGCSNFIGSFVNWDSLVVNSMFQSFKDCLVFNENISNLNTINCFSFISTFNGATSFNQPLTFDTSNVLNCYRMFKGATSFDQNLTWDLSLCTTFTEMFSGATAFNSDLNFTLGSATGLTQTFLNATNFNKPLNWDVSGITSMFNTFGNAVSFNQFLDWDVSSVTTLTSLFFGATSYNQPLDHWSFVSVIAMTNFMSGKSTEYDANYLSDLLIKLDQDLVFANMVNVNLGFGTIKYDSTGVTAYNSLVAKGFIIQSGGQL